MLESANKDFKEAIIIIFSKVKYIYNLQQKKEILAGNRNNIKKRIKRKFQNWKNNALDGLNIKLGITEEK